jgi:murein DD-endopeptidase MepM/ murein hydrolase activator NlpD
MNTLLALLRHLTFGRKFRGPTFLLIGFFLTVSRAELRGAISASEYALMQDQFVTLQSSSVLPVSGMTFDAVESAFGPRFQTSTQRYDFHRGIDVDGTQGDNIVAVLPGRFYEYVEFSAGGFTVVLEHDFAQTVTLNGRNYDHFYTYSMHLWDDGIPGNGQSTDDLLTGVTWEKLSSGNGTPVVAGQHIGEMGNSGSSGGTPYADHLHLELRAGARTSLSFQLDNLETTTQHGFDPHLNPMVLFTPLTYGVD